MISPMGPGFLIFFQIPQPHAAIATTVFRRYVAEPEYIPEELEGIDLEIKKEFDWLKQYEDVYIEEIDTFLDEQEIDRFLDKQEQQTAYNTDLRKEQFYVKLIREEINKLPDIVKEIAQLESVLEQQAKDLLFARVEQELNILIAADEEDVALLFIMIEAI